MDASDEDRRRTKARLQVELESSRYLQDISVLGHKDKCFLACPFGWTWRSATLRRPQTS